MELSSEAVALVTDIKNTAEMYRQSAKNVGWGIANCDDHGGKDACRLLVDELVAAGIPVSMSNWNWDNVVVIDGYRKGR
jgi:hypothetical protein